MVEYRHVISLGAGVQSSTLALMADKGLITYEGEVVKPVGAVFADTGSEPWSVYNWLGYLGRNVSYPIDIVEYGNLGDDALNTGHTRHGINIPMFVENKDGKTGILQRRCTADYKIKPIQKFLYWEHNIGLYTKNNRRKIDPEKPFISGNITIEKTYTVQIVQWIGISKDEAHRAKESKKPWIINYYPLIELGMTRQDCLDWMKVNNHPTPPRSACIFCPYHSDTEWLLLKKNEPAEFEKAVKWEKEMQKQTKLFKILDGVPYLHRSLKPLDEVTFKNKDDKPTQFGNECEGMCGV